MTETQRTALLAAADYISTDGASMEWDEIERIAAVLRALAQPSAKARPFGNSHQEAS